MNLPQIFCLLVICLVCANARVVKRQKRVRQLCPNKLCAQTISVIESPCFCNSKDLYGNPGTCSCQNVILESMRNDKCGCGFVESYGILNSDLSNSIKLPKSVASYDAVLPVPAANLPGIFDLIINLSPCQTTPSIRPELPSYDRRSRQIPLEFLIPEVNYPKIRKPYTEVQAYFIEEPNYQPKIIQYVPNFDCGCNNVPCRCQNAKANDVIFGLPGDKNTNYEYVRYGPQLPGVSYQQFDVPCQCQGCQQQIDLPIFSGCQPIPPPEVGCGKYLRQVTLQPPFI